MKATRRSFIKHLGLAGIVAPMTGKAIDSFRFSQIDTPLDIHIFSKHLQFLDYREAAKAAAQIGFKGLDLTVRPRGHVLPENVKENLPRAIKEIKQAGLSCDMITTAVDDAADSLDMNVIETAGAEGVTFYRSNWFRYDQKLPLEESIQLYQNRVKNLGILNKKNNIIGCYQNHSGTGIGSSFWELKQILESVDPAYFGIQYDIRHAVAEGGQSWVNGLKLLRDHIKVIVLKDFIWKRVNGQWRIVNVPIGEGMVNFTSYFKLLKDYGLNPPACLHLEYPLGGADKGRSTLTNDPKLVFEAMKRDLETSQKLWLEA